MGALQGGGLSLLLLLFTCWGWCGASGARPLVALTEPLVSVVDNFLSLLSVNASDKCQKDVKSILDSAKDGQLWALQVLDASGRPDSGMWTGGLTYPGSYSQCLNQAPGPGSMQKQHCLANLRFDNFDQSPFSNQSELPLGLIRVLNGTTVRLGLCFPASCEAPDTTDALYSAVSLSLPGSEHSSDLGDCSLQLNLPGVAPVSVVISIFAILAFLAIVGTALDVANSYGIISNESSASAAQLEASGTQACNASTEQLCTDVKTKKHKAGKVVKQVLLSFSFLRNGSKILHVGSGGGGSVDCFHGIRFLSMTWIITGHTLSFALLWMSFRNQSALSQSPSYLLSQTFANGTLSVDTFFYLSGFLLVYVAMRHLKKHPDKFNAPVMLLHRYIRLTPLMMLIIAFCAVLLPWTGQGPFWGSAVEMYGPWCQKNWWINALYLQNFIKTENMCLSHSWYSAVDMQFFVVSVAVLALLRKKPVLGLCSILLLFLVTVCVTVYLTVAHHLPGTSYIGVFPQAELTAYQSEVYIKPYCRMGPYLVGMIAGYWMQTPPNLVQLKKRYIVIGWTLAAILNLVVLYSTWPAYEGHLPSTAGAAAYSALSRTGWSIGLAWMTYACITGNGGIVNRLLSWKALVPLSRLTYCAYLIHPVVMAAFYGSREATYHFTNYFMIYLILGNLMITYVSAFVLSTLLESPFIALEKILFGS